MSNVIDLEEKRKEKIAAQKEMERATTALRPSHAELWIAVTFLAFLPWIVYFLVMSMAKPDITTAQMQDVKMLAAMLAAIISPVITFTVADIVASEYRIKSNGRNPSIGHGDLT